MIKSKYAMALYNISKKKEIIYQISKDLEILESLIKNEKFKILMESPTLSYKEKKSILSKIDFSSDLIINFSLFLIDEGNFHHFSRIVHIFHQIRRKEENVLRVKVYTPTPLRENAKSALLKLLENKLKNKIELKEYVDKNLLGGIKVEFKDKVIDATFKNYLDSIRKISIV